jgi:hypothetical protein
MATDHWLVDAMDEIAAALGMDPSKLDFVRGDWVVQCAERKGELKASEIRGRLTNSMRRHGFSMFMDPTSFDGRVMINSKRVAVYFRDGCEKIDSDFLSREIF